MAARIKAARELGDLKENAEYHIAKEDQAHLETKIKRLNNRLKEAVVVEVPAEGDTFAFGRTAEVLDEQSGDVKTWSLVGSTESDLAAGRLSAESPVGRALRDQPVGASVAIETPRGKRKLQDRTPRRLISRRRKRRSVAALIHRLDRVGDVLVLLDEEPLLVVLDDGLGIDDLVTLAPPRSGVSSREPARSQRG